MNEIEVARAEIREIVRELKPLRLRLLRAVESLPPQAPPPADVELTDPRTEIRSTVECVLKDSFDPAIRDLERVAGDA